MRFRRLSPKSFHTRDGGTRRQTSIVRKVGGLNVFAVGFVVDLKAQRQPDSRRCGGVRNPPHAASPDETIRAKPPMKVIGEVRDAAATRQMSADEGDPLERAH